MSGLAAEGLELITERELADFVRVQRWFGSKSAEIAGTTVADIAPLGEGAPLLSDALVDVKLGSGAHETYQLVIGVGEGDVPGPVIRTENGVKLYEALADESFSAELFRLMDAGGKLAAGEGTVEFAALDALGAEQVPTGSVRPVGSEQSNSSVIIDESLIVKAYRRLEAGVNPELEMLRFFAECDFAHVPSLVGWWSYAGAPLSTSLGIVQRFLPGAVDGWTLALAELPDRAGELVDRLEDLGAVVGEMHAVLSSEGSDPVFSPEEASPESLALLTATVDDQISSVFASLPDNEVIAPIARRGDDVRDLLRSLATIGSVGKRIRNHGDLHLGQTLWDGAGWHIIDFEGEPARGLTERRLKASPLRDVAGMLRSFTYAASVAGVSDGAFESAARAGFLDAYYDAMRSSSVLPPRETGDRLLWIFELEKAVYELGYELAHRPDWIGIPVAGILRLLEEDQA
jgi:trehalose synthase-fused probable maltokinase